MTSGRGRLKGTASDGNGNARLASRTVRSRSASTSHSGLQPTGPPLRRLGTLFPEAEGWLLDSVASALQACNTRADAESTVASFLGTTCAAADVVGEIFARRTAPPSPPLDAHGRALRALVREPREAPPKLAPAVTPAAALPKGRARKAAAAVQAAEQAKQALPGARWRGSVVNCLKCGCIHDCRLSSVPLAEPLRAFLASSCCLFCGAAVLEAGAESGAAVRPVCVVRRRLLTQTAQEAARSAARLVEFDGAGAKRSIVVDDQSDYVSPEDANPWLSPGERAALLEETAAAAAAADERRLTWRVSVDLIGRRVLLPAEAEQLHLEDAAALEAAARSADEAAAATESEFASGGGRHAHEAAVAAERLREEAAQTRLRMRPAASIIFVKPPRRDGAMPVRGAVPGRGAGRGVPSTQRRVVEGS